MEHYGDIMKLNGADLPPVDIITGGSPCQDLSVAGKREGLSGARSGLFMEQIRVIKEMRRATNGKQPRFMVWENVPGAFSSNEGEDFRCVLEETVKIAEPDAAVPGPPKGKWAPSGCVVGDGWSIAWRVHDAQFWGVPQRRKRIALVADFGGECAAEILFERKSLSGNLEASGEEGQEAPGDAGTGASEAGGCLNSWDCQSKRVFNPDGVCATLNSGDREGGNIAPSVCLNPWDVQSKHIQPENGIAESLYAGECRYGGGESYVMCLNDQGGGMMHVTEDVTGTLRAQEHGHQPLVFEPGVASRCGGHVYEGVAGTVRANAGDNQQAVVYGIGAYNSEGMKSPNPHSGIYEADTARTLDLNGGSPACNQGGMAVVSMATKQLSQNVGIDIAMPLCANDYKEPQVVCAGFDGNQGAKAGSVGYQVELSPTLEAEKQKHIVCAFAQNQRDEVRCLGKAAGALAAEPGVHQQTYVLQGNMIGREDRNGPQGAGINEDVSFTLNATDRHAVCIGNGQANQSIGNVVNTITSRDYKGSQCVMSYQDCTGNLDKCISKGVNNQNAHNDMLISNGYIVRRLTPLECERLQGFPVVRKVGFTEMTKDEYIAWNINEGNIVVDTEYGKVFATRGPGGIKLDEPRELTGTILNGYRVVSIRNGETKMQCRVHRIVWIAEHGIIPDGYVIDHINNDKQDNRLCNLQLLTSAENSTKARGDGLYKIHDDAGQAKITDEVHDFIQYVYGNSDLSIRQLSEIFGISKSRVHQIIHDESWTDIGDWVDSKGKKHKASDSPRYKALGNSIALPFWEWLAGRMVESLGVENPTMGSLFDGISGFCLVFARVGCKPVWASEIDEFCIAVTKKRFL